MQITLDPMLGSKIEYIWFAHPKPWKMSVGKLNHVNIKDGVIRANFTLKKKEAVDSERWDAENERLLLEVLDAENRTVIDNWLPVKESIVTATLCLGDPYGT